MEYNSRVLVDVKRKNKTYYKHYLDVIMKFINNWKNFIFAIIKDINENIEKYRNEDENFNEYVQENSKLNEIIRRDHNLYKHYFVNYTIYNNIFIQFHNITDKDIIFNTEENKIKGFIKPPMIYLSFKENIKSFLNNINLLFKINILINSDKRIKKLLSYFNNKIDDQYEYLIEYRKLMSIIEDFCYGEKLYFSMADLDFLNEFEDTIFIFYEFLNLCFVLLENNIDF